MWEIDIYDQVLTFMWSVVLGGICCFCYDTVCAIRRVYKWTYWIVFIIDLLTWVVFAFVTFIFLIVRTNGEIRNYVLFGEALGFGLLRISVSRFVVAFFTFIFNKIKNASDYIRVVFYRFFDKIEQLAFKTIKNIVKILFFTISLTD